MRSLLLPCLLAAFLSGCATLEEKRKEVVFRDTLKLYEQAIRWGNFTTATRFHRLAPGVTQTAFPPEQIRVTSYRQLHSEIQAEGNEVRISVKIDYYNDDTLKVISLTDQQVWNFYPEESAWFITTPLPAFR